MGATSSQPRQPGQQPTSTTLTSGGPLGSINPTGLPVVIATVTNPSAAPPGPPTGFMASTNPSGPPTGFMASTNPFGPPPSLGGPAPGPTPGQFLSTYPSGPPTNLGAIGPGAPPSITDQNLADISNILANHAAATASWTYPQTPTDLIGSYQGSNGGVFQITQPQPNGPFTVQPGTIVGNTVSANAPSFYLSTAGPTNKALLFTLTPPKGNNNQYIAVGQMTDPNTIHYIPVSGQESTWTKLGANTGAIGPSAITPMRLKKNNKHHSHKKPSKGGQHGKHGGKHH